MSLLRPMWSLVIEWRMSFVFPIVALLVISYPRTIYVVAGIIAITLSMPFDWMMDGPIATYADTVFYISFFVAGASVAANRIAIVEFFENWKVLRVCLLAPCVYYVFLSEVPDGFLGWLQHGILGTCLIVFCMSDPTARRLLSMKWPTYLGRISYSLYLVHIIWIGILFRVLHGTNQLIIAAIVIAASIMSADVLHRFLEAPMNRIGRSAARMIDFKFRPDKQGGQAAAQHRF